MCGISGVATCRESPIPDVTLRRITTALRHRGPDDEGYFASPDGRAALGHRRLSIVDIASGRQPIFNEDEHIAIVFNGEIYNYLELRDELGRKGHRFATLSDTEVIVHLYEEEGPDCVKRLRGMFAFAIWDGHENELFMARDRVGKKPIYYALVNGTLYFASEIQALYEVPEIPREIDYEALDLYLTYSCVPSPRSILRSIRKLPPAHTLQFHEGAITLTRYWQPDYNRKTAMDYQEAQGELVRILSDAVKLRLMGEVPLGAFLSGGIDSGTIVALMSRLSECPVKTFSIGFPDEAYNELRYAAQVARLYSTEHHEFMVEPDKLDVLGDVVRYYGEPYGDSSAVPTWHLSRVTRQHVTVALNGDGGDELFAGYPWYRTIHRFNMAANPVNQWLARTVRNVGGTVIPRRIRRALDLLSKTAAQQFQSLRSYMDEDQRAMLYHEEFRRRLATPAEDYLLRLYDHCASTHYDRAFLADFLSYLPEDLLVKVDRASMAHGLECRSPFLDQELVEFACSLPAEWKIDANRSKRILKDAFASWFPAGLVDRPKMGFTVPVGKWFRGELKGFVTDRLIHGPFRHRPLLRIASLEQLLAEHFSGARNHETRIWNLLMLSLWFEQYGRTS